MATRRQPVYKYRLVSQQCSYMVDLSEGKTSAYSYSVQVCVVVTAWCPMFDSRQGCILHGLNNNSPLFFSVAGTYLSSVRGELHKHTVDFLSVRATLLSVFY